MMGFKFREILIFFAIILCSCSNLSYKDIDVREIDSRDHKFRTEYKQKKWEEFLKLENCEKVEFVDSVMRPILLQNTELNYDSDCWEENSFSDTLLCSDLAFDDFYYWVFREVHRLTNRRPSVNVFYNSRPKNGSVFYSSRPTYRYEDSLSYFNLDINAWKDSLGCN
ncbi:MAG: hypothetical protein ACE364_07440 [Chlorobiota bacterium]